jgi:hypothetical protein
MHSIQYNATIIKKNNIFCNGVEPIWMIYSFVNIMATKYFERNSKVEKPDNTVPVVC